MLEQSSTTQNVWFESLYSRNIIACKLVLKVGQQRSKGHTIWVMPKIGRKEMFYLTTHSTHFIYGYMASDIW